MKKRDRKYTVLAVLSGLLIGLLLGVVTSVVVGPILDGKGSAVGEATDLDLYENLEGDNQAVVEGSDNDEEEWEGIPAGEDISVDTHKSSNGGGERDGASKVPDSEVEVAGEDQGEDQEDGEPDKDFEVVVDWTGVVVDEGGNPVEGVELILRAEAYDSRGGESRGIVRTYYAYATDSEGRFRLKRKLNFSGAEGADHAQVLLLAFHDDYLRSNTIERVMLAGEEEPQSGLKLVIRFGGTLSGTIVDVYGQPAAGVALGIDGRRVWTNEYGEFKSDLLEPGQYKIAPPQGMTLDAAASYRVNGRSDTSTGRVTLRPATAVRFSVTSDGNPIDTGYLIVTLLGEDGSQIRRRVSADEGDFVLTGIPAGTWQVEIWRAGHTTEIVANIVVAENEWTDLGSIHLSPQLSETGKLLATGD